MSRTFIGVLVAVAVLAAGCTEGSHEEPVVVEAWFHEAEGGQRQALDHLVRDFNEANAGVTVLLRVLPEVSYAEQVAEAAETGTLPDLLDLNRSMLVSGVAGRLLPVGSLLSPAIRERLVPEAVAAGRQGRQLMAVPTSAQVVVLGAVRQELLDAGVARPGGADDPWSLAEMEAALELLTEPDRPALRLPSELDDLGVVLAAMVRSAGGTVGDEAAERTVVTLVGGWLARGWATREPLEERTDPAEVPPLHLAPAELVDPESVVSAAPDLGTGSRGVLVGYGWAVPEDSEHVAEAVHFIQFLLGAEQVSRLAEAAGGVAVVRGQWTDGSQADDRRARIAHALISHEAARPLPADATEHERLAALARAVVDVGEGRASPSEALAGIADG